MSEPLREGKTRKGGINDAPTKPRPPTHPPAQGGSAKAITGIGERLNALEDSVDDIRLALDGFQQQMNALGEPQSIVIAFDRFERLERRLERFEADREEERRELRKAIEAKHRFRISDLERDLADLKKKHVATVEHLREARKALKELREAHDKTVEERDSLLQQRDLARTMGSDPVVLDALARQLEGAKAIYGATPGERKVCLIRLRLIANHPGLPGSPIDSQTFRELLDGAEAWLTTVGALSE